MVQVYPTRCHISTSQDQCIFHGYFPSFALICHHGLLFSKALLPPGVIHVTQ